MGRSLKITAQMLGLDPWTAVVHVQMEFDGPSARCHCETIAGEVANRRWIRDLKKHGYPSKLNEIARQNGATELVVWATPVNRRIRQWMLDAGGVFVESTHTKIEITIAL